MDKVFPILTQFGLTAPFEVVGAPSGLIHKTFFVNCKEGEFVIQELHKVVRPETCEDAKVICDYVRKQGISVPEFLITQEGRPWYRASDGSLWRAMMRLPGVSHSMVTSPEEVYEAARFLGKFHEALAQFSYACKGAIPHFHDTPYIFQQFKKIISSYKETPLSAPVSSYVSYILEHAPKEFLPAGLPCQIVHGDPKISNFLFDKGVVTDLVDFDTCMNHTRLVDIGDALRSWCNRGGEDTKPVFDQALYNAALDGYGDSAVLEGRERMLIPQAFRLITIELAMRFLQDYFDDSYFGWDPTKFASRREHNLVRAKGQIEIYRQIQNL